MSRIIAYRTTRAEWAAIKEIQKHFQFRSKSEILAAGLVHLLMACHASPSLVNRVEKERQRANARRGKRKPKKT
jgi:hypothetical protein